MSTTGTNLTPSLVRTLVPFLVGGLGSWAARQGLDINDDALATLLTIVIGFGFYAVVRFLEVFAGPKWGYVLGIAKSPGYVQDRTPARAPLQTRLGTDEGVSQVTLIVLVVLALIAVFFVILPRL